MKLKFIAFTMVTFTLAINGCSMAKKAPPAAFAGSGNGRASNMLVFADSPAHYVAERHSIDLIAPETQLQKS